MTGSSSKEVRPCLDMYPCCEYKAWVLTPCNVCYVSGSSSWGRASQSSSQTSQRSTSDFDFGGTGKREEFYGFGDFFRDLDKELSDLEARGGAAFE